MEAEFNVSINDVIDIATRKKTGNPWGVHPDEQYTYLVFFEDGVIRMTVNSFHKIDANTYRCCRFYTDFVANTMEEYKALSEERLASIAYSAWCSGAR